MLILFWTPLNGHILRTLIGVEEMLAVQARVPLMFFSFFPLAVMLRAYLHAVGLLEHRTRALAPGGPACIAAILVVLLILTATNVAGATRGVAALLAGFRRDSRRLARRARVVVQRLRILTCHSERPQGVRNLVLCPVTSCIQGSFVALLLGMPRRRGRTAVAT